MPHKHNTPKRQLTRSPIDKAKAYEVVWPRVAPLFQAARLYLDASFVYVIGEPDEGPIKIGFSKDPIGRLRNMQTGNSRRLRMEYVLVGAMGTEKLLHHFWESHAILSASKKGTPGAAPGTEWFKPEARTQLLPIVERAVALQIEMLKRDEPQTSFSELEGAVREAHAESGFVAHMHEPTILLAQGPGYVVSRRSRI